MFEIRGSCWDQVVPCMVLSPSDRLQPLIVHCQVLLSHCLPECLQSILFRILVCMWDSFWELVLEHLQVVVVEAWVGRGRRFDEVALCLRLWACIFPSL